MPNFASSSDLAEAIEDGQSPSLAVRAVVGPRLAAHAGIASAAAVLERLLLDPEDTFVTRQTAEALLKQRSLSAVRLVARALAHADDTYGDWLLTAVYDVISPPGEALREISTMCAALADDPDRDVRRGAAELAAWMST
ncbi:hypothetical protein OIE69_19725 [Actinacidiphila glaucinigra]|uniref:hypothetical protein n=1 Tax=Actinacidiphila glaucinigra TaxID=235986 RepID=UPI002DD8C4BE|nr:hypothetical protein [Actinacidiphila glaucinigra]WSD60984.1 hypothetical protein OIE69_19725 [Actinacidiphila glaucinigra]